MSKILLEVVGKLFKMLPDCWLSRKLVFKWFGFVLSVMVFFERIWVRYYVRKRDKYSDEEILVQMKSNWFCPKDLHNAYREVLEGTY